MLQELEEIPNEWIGEKLKSLLRWQVSKGIGVGYAVGWYLRYIIVDSREVLQHHRVTTAKHREKTFPQRVNEKISPQ